jgi:hypothetical protein
VPSSWRAVAAQTGHRAAASRQTTVRASTRPRIVVSLYLLHGPPVDRRRVKAASLRDGSLPEGDDNRLGPAVAVLVQTA